MASARERIPYESQERLQDRKQKDQISNILGLDSDKLTNVDVQPLPYMVGAGRVKKFRDKSPDPQNRTQQSSAEDIEMQSIPSPQPQPSPKRGGYPALANFIGSDKDFFIFRKFNVLSARNLLFLQDGLSELEKQLNSIDIAESERGNPRDLWNLSSRREDENLERKKLMRVLSVKIKEYQKALQSQARTLALEDVTDLTVESVSNWLDNMKPIVEPESHFLDDKNDLVSLSGEQSSKELLERYLENNWHHLFVTKAQNQRKTSAPNTEYYSASSIKQAARLIICLLAVLFSILPLPFLSRFHDPNVRLAIITGFTFLFATMFSVLTKSRTSEIFTVMAGYAAFLVVFVGGSG